MREVALKPVYVPLNITSGNLNAEVTKDRKKKCVIIIYILQLFLRLSLPSAGSSQEGLLYNCLLPYLTTDHQLNMFYGVRSENQWKYLIYHA